jgi:hypothetical protein
VIKTGGKIIPFHFNMQCTSLQMIRMDSPGTVARLKAVKGRVH